MATIVVEARDTVRTSPNQRLTYIPKSVPRLREYTQKGVDDNGIHYKPTGKREPVSLDYPVIGIIFYSFGVNY